MTRLRSHPRGRGSRALLAGALAGIAALAGLAAAPGRVAGPLAPARANAASACATPPAVLPVDQIEPGMTGHGLTTIAGQTPTSFRVEVLGVQPDAILPGVPLVIVRLSGQ